MERTRQPVRGLVLATLAALAFGVGGPFGKAMYEIGWSPSAVVLARCVGVLVALAIPAAVALRGRWAVLRRNVPTIVVYGAVAVVGAQLCFYSAIRFMPIGAALLIEYLAPGLLVGVAWLRTGRRPGVPTLAGSAVAIGGLALVVDLGGTRTEPLGPILAFAAAIGAAAYYLVSARSDPELPTVALLAGSMLVGATVLLVVAGTGVAPLTFGFGEARLLGAAVPWWAPIAVVVGISTLAAYLLGIAGSVRLGSRVASFVGLLEVLFAVLASWALLGDLPAPVQFAGGALILAGVVLVRSQREVGVGAPSTRTRSPLGSRSARAPEASRSSS